MQRGRERVRERVSNRALHTALHGSKSANHEVKDRTCYFVYVKGFVMKLWQDKLDDSHSLSNSWETLVYVLTSQKSFSLTQTVLS